METNLNKTKELNMIDQETINAVNEVKNIKIEKVSPDQWNVTEIGSWFKNHLCFYNLNKANQYIINHERNKNT